MTKNETKKRVEKLRLLINRERYSYHVLNRQNLSDEALDSLKHELFLLESRYPDLVSPDSPTQRVGGAPLKKFEKVEHRVPMLSIEDVFSEEELRDWEQYARKLSKGRASEYFAELKVDGFAVSLQYRDGVLARGSTRGNGQVGEDVTQNLKTIESIPLRLHVENVKFQIPSASFEVRGEVYMEKAGFERFNEERIAQGEEPYANPRNLAAGSIRQLDPKLAASRPLKFLAYDVVSDVGQTLHSEEHELLRVLGFPTDRTARICSSIDEVIAYWNEIAKRRESLPHMIDGIVVSVNENVLFRDLGVAGKSPRGIRACKFSGKQATTKVLDIILQVGRTGAITPVAVLAPVRIAGVTVSRATLHNEDEIKKRDVRIGDTVIVERAGDVIPAVLKALPELRTGKKKKFVMPNECPVCGEALRRKAGEAAWRCVNKDCSAQKREFLYHFVSRKAFDIDGLGPKIIDTLVAEHLVSDPSDFFTLKEGDVALLDRFGEKSAHNLVHSIQKSMRVPLERFLYGLGIRHVGEETARALARHFGSLANLQSAGKEDLANIADVGAVVAESIFSWFRRASNIALIKKLISAGVVVESEHSGGGEERTQPLRGLSFVFTGTLESISRDEAKEKARALGAKTPESVSRETNYLVSGKNPGSKLTAAKKLGIRILAEKEFLNLIKTSA